MMTMNHDLAFLFIVGLLYLFFLFWLASAADRGKIPSRWIAHPIVYTLSLGVYATSWTYYGSVGFAHESGLLFLTIYLGATLAFILSPVLLQPILRLTSDYQLTSLPDLFAFRYRSQLAGALATVFMLLGTLPYIALQIRAVAESLHVLSRETPSNSIAFVFCVTLSLFAILFGARHISNREKHLGLVAAIAFESLIKLLVFLLIGLFALFQVFDGPPGLEQFLQTHPEALDAFYQPVGEDPWLTLLFLSFCAAFLLPRQFHLLFTENINPNTLKFASWAFPAFLLLLNLPIPIILWAGESLQLDIPADYFTLGVTLTHAPPWLSVLAFIGGLSAASAMVIVTTLALASMSLNNLLLPASHPDPARNLYRWVLWGKRILIALIIMAGYLVYVSLPHKEGLVQLGLISFVAVAQFIPGIIGLLYWSKANRNGFIIGLLGGISVWGVVLLGPMLYESGTLTVQIPVSDWLAHSGMSQWTFATFYSLSLNSLLFVLFSLLTRQSQREQEAANACRAEGFIPLEGVVDATSPDEFRVGLAAALGQEMADREVDQALLDLHMRPQEQRAAELRRLRERIERNLSGLIGPEMAHMIVNQRLLINSEAKTALADSVQYVEERLQTSRSELHGLNAELDNLWRLHRQILQELPLGVCATNHQNEIVLWNLSLEVMTQLPGRQVVGMRLEQLPEPWRDFLLGFARANDEHTHRLQLEVNHAPRWYNLHKAHYIEPDAHRKNITALGKVIILEDLTNLNTLEVELAHNDRLASIGRLAAGVAHEIGNPLTGVTSLAQNLRDEADSEIIKETAEDILKQSRRIADILKILQSFSRGGQYLNRHELFALSDVIKDAMHLMELTNKQAGIHFISHCPDHLYLQGDKQQISQVLVNLLRNAADASKAGDKVTLDVRTKADQMIISISDQGSGIPDKLHARILEPFFTTKSPGEGTGLGLAVVNRIVEEHHGDLHIQSNDCGTTISVALPRPASTDQKNDLSSTCDS